MAATLAVAVLRIVRLAALPSAFGFSLAHGQALSDPTRPPASTSNAPATTAEGAGATQVGVGIVVTGKEGTIALVDGHTLRVGSRTQGGVVTHIAPDAVFVRAADGKVTRLPLYPAVGVQTGVSAGKLQPDLQTKQQERSTNR